MSFPSDWMQHNFLDDTRNEIPPPTTATAVTSRNTNPALDHGRGAGARPIRRRSRASRRTPTTLLNTDTTNFRAMVQQFTGIPTAAASAYTAAPHLNNPAGTLDFTQRYAGHLPSNMYPAGSGGAHAQYPNQMQQQHMFMVGDMHGGGGGGGRGDVTTHAPPGSSSTNENRGHDNYMF